MDVVEYCTISVAFLSDEFQESRITVAKTLTANQDLASAFLRSLLYSSKDTTLPVAIDHNKKREPSVFLIPVFRCGFPSCGNRTNLRQGTRNSTSDRRIYRHCDYFVAIEGKNEEVIDPNRLTRGGNHRKPCPTEI